MVGEIYAGLSAFKNMLDMAKALKEINDATIRNSAVIELQEKILAAREAQSALLDRVRELEERVAGFEAFEAEKDRYHLKSLGWGSLAYMLKPDSRRTEPPHWICTNCYSSRRISIVQRTIIRGEGYRWSCPACKTNVIPSPEAINGDDPKWLE